MDPMKYLYGTLMLVGKLARWLILLSEFDIEYATKKTVKGIAVANFLAAHPVEDDEPWEIDFAYEHLNLIEKKEWKLYFNWSAYGKGAGVGALLNLHMEVKEDRLKPYIDYLHVVGQNFTKVTFAHTSRVNNRVPDSLANLASTWEEISSMPKKPFIMSSGSILSYEGDQIVDFEEDDQPWFIPIQLLEMTNELCNT
ncbi:uncharacterized protein LOC110009701 [Jatropha curcas]|uniref:uncharacterized protein LOC110009701 n=1 Tax=Jatropha curcas TaxID=180498 RepID=UPI0009D74411|nr:uncharacterized protein LOC110009701 [Jatropha curcas]